MHSGHPGNIPVTDPRAWALRRCCATQDAADEVAMDAQQHHWVSYAAEPHVYLLLVGVLGTFWLLSRAWCRCNWLACMLWQCRLPARSHCAPAHSQHVGAQIAEASWCGPLVRHESLRGVLVQLHRAVQLLHGSIQQLLQQVAEQADMQKCHRHVVR